MRFCLKCRAFSGGGPLCTRCGRSFGGRLCKGRTKHLNPHDAQFCNHCGTTDLYEAATSIPLGWVSRLIILTGIYFVGRWLMFQGGHTPEIGQVVAQSIEGTRVWIINKFFNLMIILLFFSGLSAFIPGEAGKQFRSIMFGLVGRAFALLFKILEQVVLMGGRLLLSAVGLESFNKKKK
ncbi:hypothetical protein IAD21_06050 [Abditibacteriota bacterium]|nr:hypothetical protein IAD21_06050 [Abditibacteriota bacterium]